MSSLTAKIALVNAQNVLVTEDTLAVDLIDGRTIAVPLVWYPRLWHGTAQERNKWELIGYGMGIIGLSLMKISVWWVNRLIGWLPDRVHP